MNIEKGKGIAGRRIKTGRPFYLLCTATGSHLNQTVQAILFG